MEGDSAGGCFSGDKKVALADGRNLSFKELIVEQEQGKKNYCYTLDNKGQIKIAEIKDPRITKRNASITKVILDNDEEIICTPNHKFRLTTGEYIEAKDLTKDMNLAPLYRQFSKKEGKITIEGYEMVYDNQRNIWIFTHILSDEFNLENGIYKKEQGEHRHHKDFNKKNNSPENILRISKEKHLDLHRKMAQYNLQTKEVLEKLRELRKTPEYREKVRKTLLSMKEELSKRAKKQWENTEYKEYMAQKFKEFYNTNKEYQQKNNKLLN